MADIRRLCASLRQGYPSDVRNAGVRVRLTSQELRDLRELSPGHGRLSQFVRDALAEYVKRLVED